MDALELRQYRDGLTARRQRRFREQEERRLTILARLRKAVAHLLASQEAGRVVIHGSLLAPGRFHADSEVALVIYGLRPGKWYQTLRFFEEWEGLREVVIDLRFASESPAAFLAFVEQHGESH